MAITFSLAPIPKWPIINQIGTLAGGAKLYTWSNLNRVVQKPVFQDAAGTIPYTNPIVFDENGTQGPFYWSSDSTNTADTYFLQAFDSSNNLLWTIPNYAPGQGGGGGGGGTTYVPLNNLIANNVFLNHIDDTAQPVASTNLVLSPGNHIGMVEYVPSALGSFGAVGPDTRFVKNNTDADDKIYFVPFIAGDDPLNGDTTPSTYIRYTCGNSPTESFKSFQFPICQGVTNLDNQQMTLKVWAKTASGTALMDTYFRQYFGSGGSPSTEVRFPISSSPINTTWTPLVLNFTVPSIVGKTLGTCGDDASYIQIGMPLGSVCDIWFTKPALYLGNINPTIDFNTYDEINSLIDTPRPMDIKFSGNSYTMGWVPANNGTIGNKIGATSSNATTRANQDTFPLYNAIWNAMNATAQSYAPMYTSAGILTSYGASAVADFSAYNQISLTKSLGQVMAGTNTIIPNRQTFTVNTGSSNSSLNVTNAVVYGTATPVNLLNSGGALPSGLVNNLTYYSIFINATTMKLALTMNDALTGTSVTFSDNGSGTNTIGLNYAVTGFIAGNLTHTLLAAELPPHSHTQVYPNTPNTVEGGGGAGIFSNVLGTIATGNGPGASTPFGIIQPTTYMNIFFKL